MQFYNGNLIAVNFEVFEDCINLLSPKLNVDIERTIYFIPKRNEDGEYTLELTYYIIFSNQESKDMLANYIGTFNFHIRSDGQSIEDDLIDLFNHLNTGQKKALFFVISKEPRLLVSVGNNPKIPELCEKIIASLTNFGFYKP